MERKVYFATQMRFTTESDNMPPLVSVINIFRFFRESPDEESFVDVVFVHNAEEAAGFPENVLVAWPSNNYLLDDDIPIIGTFGQIPFAVGAIKLHHPDVDFRNYGLPENEITMFDVVENWEIVYEIFEEHQESL